MPNSPPKHNPDVERAVLGAMMLNTDKIPVVKKLLKPPDFQSRDFPAICEAIFELGKDTTPGSVIEYLNRKHKGQGVDHLSQICETSISAGVEYHARLVREAKQKLTLWHICKKTEDGLSGQNISEILSYVKNEIRNIESDQEDDFKRSDAAVKAVFKIMEDSENVIPPGINTGFSQIDEKTSGWEPQTTHYLIARPSIGKTALALNIADNIVKRYSGAVVFFSLESSYQALTRRRLASYSNLNPNYFKSGIMQDKEWEEAIRAADRVSDTNFIIVDHPRYKELQNLIAMAETIAMREPVRFIVIDHLIRMRTSPPKQSKNLELGFITEEISSLAKELNIPILVLAQLNRQIESRPPKQQYPRLSDIRESGMVEENADGVYGLWRENKESDKARFECLKGRDFPAGWVTWFDFDRSCQVFTQADYEPVETERDWQDL